MKKDQVQIGGTYVAKVSGQLADVRIDAESRFGGWEATNVATRRKVRIKSAQRLRRPVTPDNGTTAPRAEEAVVRDDPPPEDATVANDAAQEANVEDDGDAEGDGPFYDPDVCATEGCGGTPMLTHLKRPLCQACWERQCEEQPTGEGDEESGDAGCPANDQETTDEENAMSKKKKSSKKSKTQKTTKQSKGEKKAAKAKASGEKKTKRVSALDAAAQVLAKSRKPMRAQELVAAMTEQGLWSSPAGKTPHATLYAAMLREARDKGRDARFRKVDRGQFEYAGKEK